MDAPDYGKQVNFADGPSGETGQLHGRPGVWETGQLCRRPGLWETGQLRRRPGLWETGQLRRQPRLRETGQVRQALWETQQVQYPPICQQQTKGGGNKNYRLLFFIKKIKQQATIFFSGICYL